MEQICQQESHSNKDRRLSFFMDNMEMRDFLTLNLESGQQITVCFKIENQQQEHFVGQQEGCNQFVSLMAFNSQSHFRNLSACSINGVIQPLNNWGLGCQTIAALMSRNAHNNKIGKITKYRRQFDDFYNFGKYGDCGEFLSNHQMYVNQFHTWWPAMLAKLANISKRGPNSNQ